jgi:hypothetical protein
MHAKIRSLSLPLILICVFGVVRSFLCLFMVSFLLAVHTVNTEMSINTNTTNHIVNTMPTLLESRRFSRFTITIACRERLLVLVRFLCFNC